MQPSNPFRSFLAAALLAASAGLAPAQENVWVSHGPNDVGWIYDLAIADSVAYAATINGVFLSHDRGATWRQAGLEGAQILQIVARSGSPVVLALSDRLEAYVSRDRGESWAPVIGPSYARAAGIDPDQLSTIYAGYNTMIWKSTDAGVSWQTLAAPGDHPWPEAFAFNSGAVYVVSYSHLFKSVDGGISWSSAQPPFHTVGAIAAGASDGVVYASGVLASGADAGMRGFCRSLDSAATWTCSVSPAGDFLEIPGQTPASTRFLAASTTSNTSRGTTVTSAAFLSRDGGATWAPVSGGLEGPVQAFASDASGSFVLAGTDQQVFRSEDRGDTWTPFRSGLKAIRIGALALDPQQPSTIWTGGTGYYAGGPGLFRSTDSGLSWSPAGGPQGPKGVDVLLIDPANPRRIYAGWDRVFRTDDGGETWSSAFPNTAAKLTSLALDPADHSRVWAGIGPGHVGRTSRDGPYSETGAGLFVSNEARMWATPSIAQSIYSILFDTRRPGTIYAGSYYDLGLSYGTYGHMTRKGGSIFISHDNGATFTRSDIDFRSRVESIVADPFIDAVLYLSAGRRVFRSHDAGATWAAHGVGNRVSDQIVADPVRPGRLYGSGDPGVFRSEDWAQTWQDFSEGLPNISTGPLAISPDGRWLYAGTDAAGVYSRDLGALPCAVSATRLCLAGNRYAVDLYAGRRGEPPSTPGAARTLADRSGYFSLPFVTGDAELPEVVVKVLGEGALGLDGNPVFYSSLTTLPYRLLVTDTHTGAMQAYQSDAAQPLCGAVDVAFEHASASAPVHRAAAESASTLPLLNGRFSVSLEARRASTGATSAGRAIASGDRYGFFTLPGFTSDPTLPEVIVKMLDFRSITGSFLLFYTGLTSLDYTLTVTDTVSGAVRTYESPGDYCGVVPPTPSPTDGRHYHETDGSLMDP